MKKVLVLMSTYNGEKYIREQLDSIQNQDYSNKFLLIRDDGSTDNTIPIIQEYQQRFSNISLIIGKNIGVWRSFFELCKEANGKAEYYALADQDDYWMPDKISAAVTIIENYKSKIPFLYAGNKTLVDSTLQPIQSEIDYSFEQIPSFGNALVENICTGCTCVMNQALLTEVCKYMPEKVIMHDWWIYLIATVFGTVIYDTNSYILYRQHGENVYGTIVKKKSLFYHRLKELGKKRGRVYEQICSLKEYVPLSFEKRKMADKVLESRNSLSAKWNLLNDKRIGRQGKKQKLIYIGLVLLGKL